MNGPVSIGLLAFVAMMVVSRVSLATNFMSLDQRCAGAENSHARKRSSN